jgi:hypothetical protein
LFRGGLTNETLETLLEGESGAATDEASYYDCNTKRSLLQSEPTLRGQSRQNQNENFPISDATAIGSSPPHAGSQRDVSYHQPASSIGASPKNDDDREHLQRIPSQDQRTVLITNLPERTTHKDLVNIVRGGRLLDIFLRNDRTATISFVEGAAEFLFYAKRTDIYLYTKRVSTDLVARTGMKLTMHSSNAAGLIASSKYRAMYPTKFQTEQRAILLSEAQVANSLRLKFEITWTIFTIWL